MEHCWHTILAERDRQGRPRVWLVSDDDRSLLAQQRDRIEWGYRGSGPWWLARVIASAVFGTIESPADGPVITAILDRLEAADWQGFRIRAVDIERAVGHLVPALESNLLASDRAAQ